MEKSISTSAFSCNYWPHPNTIRPVAFAAFFDPHQAANDLQRFFNDVLPLPKWCSIPSTCSESARSVEPAALRLLRPQPHFQKFCLRAKGIAGTTLGLPADHIAQSADDQSGADLMHLGRNHMQAVYRTCSPSEYPYHDRPYSLRRRFFRAVPLEPQLPPLVQAGEHSAPHAALLVLQKER
ncbi:MAG: hypothetical protein U0894_08510 [Pirellulales bacterium]